MKNETNTRNSQGAIGRQPHIRSTIRQGHSSVKKFSHAERRFFERRVPPVLAET